MAQCNYKDNLYSKCSVTEAYTRLLLERGQLLTEYHENSTPGRLDGFCSTNFKMQGLCESLYQDNFERLIELREKSGIDAHFATKTCTIVPSNSPWLVHALCFLSLLLRLGFKHTVCSILFY